MSLRPTPLLQKDPLTVDTVQYDFENYALEYGIPETLDPLPYRKVSVLVEAVGAVSPSAAPLARDICNGTLTSSFSVSLLSRLDRCLRLEMKRNQS